ncbi:hypothetical protein [Methylobacterium sp. Leaf456]|uniref:hypothetical protein n=1 Tax=Methylobacterium sp. Leaf456 TaxID=1736382 RepID=UPI000AC3102F|nr:hypothetical protein [Methylobacterium sp. Leaf456]
MQKTVSDLGAVADGTRTRRRARWGLALAAPVFGVFALGSAGAAPITGTGGGPETTVNAPYRAGTGQTVPPGRDAAPDIDPNARTERQKRLDGVLDSICESCGERRTR